MRKKREPKEPTFELATQPFYYEIRVKGRLSSEQWTAWFNNLAVSTRRGESVLQGTLPDHAALYGLLARLRDLAVPLLSVKVLDAEAQRMLRQQRRRYELVTNILLLTVYLVLLGGMAAVTTFLTADGVLHTALALALLFAALGVLSYTFSLWSAYRGWRWLAYSLWASSLLTFLIYVAVANLLPTALAIALILFVLAGGLIYLMTYLQSRARKVESVIVEWEALGRRSGTDGARRRGEPATQEPTE